MLLVTCSEDTTEDITGFVGDRDPAKVDPEIIQKLFPEWYEEVASSKREYSDGESSLDLLVTLCDNVTAECRTPPSRPQESLGRVEAPQQAGGLRYPHGTPSRIRQNEEATRYTDVEMDNTSPRCYPFQHRYIGLLLSMSIPPLRPLIEHYDFVGAEVLSSCVDSVGREKNGQARDRTRDVPPLSYPVSVDESSTPLEQWWLRTVAAYVLVL